MTWTIVLALGGVVVTLLTGLIGIGRWASGFLTKEIDRVVEEGKELRQAFSAAMLRMDTRLDGVERKVDRLELTTHARSEHGPNGTPPRQAEAAGDPVPAGDGAHRGRNPGCADLDAGGGE